LNKGYKESWHAIYDGKDLMVKMGKLVLSEKSFLRNEIPKKIVKQITSPKSALNYRSNQTFIAESRVVSSLSNPGTWVCTRGLLFSRIRVGMAHALHLL
jgi:hypothetical protein